MHEFLPHIDKEVIQTLNNAAFNGEIVVVDNLRLVDSAVAYLSQFKELGFDTETRPSFHKGKKHKMALLQLSADDKAFLFRLHAIDIPESLATLLADEDIKKIGAAVHDDIKGLAKITKFTPAGFVDLQKMVQDYGIIDKSVQKIAAIVLNVKVSKAQRLTNWENEELTDSQQLYAATDAWICLKIYKKLLDSQN